MPTPNGEITTSQIWQQEGSDSPTLLVNAGLVSDVSKLIMGGGDSFEVAADIIRLVTAFNNKEEE
jgi:hypothetical protein